jgi:hypothetical protein
MRDPRDDLEDDRPDAPAGLFLSRRGNWFHDGDRLRHQGLVGLLDRSVARANDGSLVVTTGKDVLSFACEDCPVFVRAVDRDGADLIAVLSTGRREPIDGALMIGADHRFRSTCHGGDLWALWTRAAQQTLEPLLQQGDDGVALVHGERSHPMVTLDTDWSQVPTSMSTRGRVDRR